MGRKYNITVGFDDRELASFVLAVASLFNGDYKDLDYICVTASYMLQLIVEADIDAYNDIIESIEKSRHET